MDERKLKVKSSRFEQELKRSVQYSDEFPPEIDEILEELRTRFRDKFGRDPEPDDPIFFDPHVEVPLPLKREALDEMWGRLAAVLLCTGEIAPEAAYAMKKTGLLVTDATRDLLTNEERTIWQAAITEYLQRPTFPAVNCSTLDRSTPLHRPASSLEQKRS